MLRKCGPLVSQFPQLFYTQKLWRWGGGGVLQGTADSIFKLDRGNLGVLKVNKYVHKIFVFRISLFRKSLSKPCSMVFQGTLQSPGKDNI